MRHHATAAALTLALLAGIAAPVLARPNQPAKPSPDEQVKALVEKYAEYRRKDNYTRLRMNVIRDLGKHKLPRARKALFKILRATKSPDERILAVGSIARIADAEAAENLTAAVVARKTPELFHELGGALGRSNDPGVKAWLAGTALDARQPILLTALIRAVGLQRLEGALPRLTKHYGDGVVDARNVDVLHETVRAIGRIGGPDAKPLLLKAAVHDKWRIRLAAADVLPHQNAQDKDIHTRIRTLFTDRVPQVIEALARAVGDARFEAMMPIVIDALEAAPRLRTRDACYRTLKAFSKLDFHHDAAAWRLWWKHRSDPTKTPKDIQRITFARYYGGYVGSDRVAFIVDLSGSMSWPQRKKTHRIDVARTQLFRVLKDIPNGHLFNVIVFSNKVRAWSKREQVVDDASRARARKWVDKHFAEPDGDTLTYDALLDTLESNRNCDTIYLLSDGNPSHGHYKSSEGLRAMVAVRNRYRRVAIHTIALTLLSLDRGRPILSERPAVMKAFMRALAADNNGTCQVIERPPK